MHINCESKFKLIHIKGIFGCYLLRTKYWRKNRLINSAKQVGLYSLYKATYDKNPHLNN